MSSPSHGSLRRVPIFAGLGEDSLSHVATLFAEFEAPAGTGCFIIEEGSVRVDLRGTDTVELGPGDFFGELSVPD